MGTITTEQRQAVIDEIANLATAMPGTKTTREAFKAGLRWVVGEMNRKNAK